MDTLMVMGVVSILATLTNIVLTLKLAKNFGANDKNPPESYNVTKPHPSKSTRHKPKVADDYKAWTQEQADRKRATPID